MTAPIPASVLAETDQWGRFFAEEWAQDFPSQMTAGPNQLGADGTPRWRADFAAWLSEAQNDENRGRTARAMKQLRRKSPRAYEVLYRAMLEGESFEQITAWLNERAVRNNIPLPKGKLQHYVLKDAVVLFVYAVDWARYHW